MSFIQNLPRLAIISSNIYCVCIEQVRAGDVLSFLDYGNQPVGSHGAWISTVRSRRVLGTPDPSISPPKLCAALDTKR